MAEVRYGFKNSKDEVDWDMKKQRLHEGKISFEKLSASMRMMR